MFLSTPFPLNTPSLLRFQVTDFVFLKNSGFSFVCHAIDYSTTERGMYQAHLSYMYFALKLIDYLDTIFFILRKKTAHVSFLHVYHHVVVSVGAYMCVLYATGE